MIRRFAFWVGAVIFCLFVSACTSGRFIYLDQPRTYKPSQSIKVSFKVEPVSIIPDLSPPVEGCGEYHIGPPNLFGDSWTPIVQILMPEAWRLEGCQLSDGIALSNRAEPIGSDSKHLHSQAEAVRALREQYELELPPGYKEELAKLPPGQYIDPFGIECAIVPGDECGLVELTYGVYSENPIQGFESLVAFNEAADDCQEEYEAWLLKEKIIVSRPIGCQAQSVPTVTGGGILAIGGLLALFGIRQLRRRKPRT